MTKNKSFEPKISEELKNSVPPASVYASPNGDDGQDFKGDWKKARYNRFAIQRLLDENEALKAKLEHAELGRTLAHQEAERRLNEWSKSQGDYEALKADRDRLLEALIQAEEVLRKGEDFWVWKVVKEALASRCPKGDGV